MAYCTLADIKDQIDEAELILYTDDGDEGEVNTDVVDAAIDGAGALIDAYLAAKYAVPVDPAPSILETLAVDIAIYKIAARRNRESDSVRTRYEDAVKFLKDVAAGKAVVAGVTAVSGSGSRDHAKIEADTRIFTRTKMGGF